MSFSFGSPAAPNTPTASSFGSTFNNTAGTLFGGNAGFGATSQPATNTGFGGFGAPAATTGGFGGFGATSQPAAAPATGGFGGFGAASQPATNTGFGGFGATSQPATAPATGGFGAFGATSQPAATSTTGGFGGFGASTATTGGFGGFGATSQPAAAPAAGGFGGFGTASQPTTNTGFGGFGATSQPAAAPTTGGFGGFGATSQPASNTGFGGFGAPAATTGGFGGFGATSQPAAAPATGGFGGFGAPAATTGGFGGFGAASQPATNTGFGGFGATSQPAAAPAGGFGGFGGFGAPASTAGGFGGFGATSQPAANTAAGGFAANPPQVQEKVWQDLALIRAHFDPTSPLCHFRHYFYNMVPANEVHQYIRPQNQDEQLWNEAMRKNPDTTCLVPVLATGFDDILKRMEVQSKQVELHQEKLKETGERLTNVQRQYALSTLVKLEEHKRRNTDLTQRLLRLLRYSQVLRYKGFPLNTDETKSIELLSQLVNQISNPDLANKLNVLWSQLQMIKQQNITRQGKSEVWRSVSEDDTSFIAKVLEDEQNGILHITNLLKQDSKAIEDIEENLKAHRSNNNVQTSSF